MDLINALPVEDLIGTPLSEKRRPRDLDQFIGHKQIVEQVQKYLDSGYLPNLILYGPPGIGKTSFAKIIAQRINAQFISLNAVETGAKSLKELGEKARQDRRHYSQRTVVFVDEIHRFNKAQQDVLLSFIETGDLILIGATTENPSYELNHSLLSRSRIFHFKPLTSSDLKNILDSALAKENLQSQQVLDSSAEKSLLEFCDGDARKLLNFLEDILAEYFSRGHAFKAFNQTQLMEKIGSITQAYGKKSKSHFDILSAMIKSLRGSDADSALFYFAYMIKNGEDPRLLARRLIVFASEDIGNADPKALEMAVAGLQSFEAVGMPEGAINLAQVMTYLASAPKSNRSYLAFKKAIELVERSPSLQVPIYLQNDFKKQTNSIEREAEEKNYLYPHDYPKNWVKQNYWPINVEKATLYEPSDSGFEKKIKEYKTWQQS